MTPISRSTFSSSYSCVVLKYGSYCLTGLPLLLRIVRPLPTQRGSASTSALVPSGFT